MTPAPMISDEAVRAVSAHFRGYTVDDEQAVRLARAALTAALPFIAEEVREACRLAVNDASCGACRAQGEWDHVFAAIRAAGGKS